MKFIYCFFFFLFSFFFSQAQGFNYSLSGNPVNTTGWTLGGSNLNGVFTSYVSNDEIVLTNATNSLAGYIYTQTAQDLKNCSQFTASFDFKISTPGSEAADGISFWFLNNPSNFTGNQSIGMPGNPNGLVLVFDTYHNGGTQTNPKISLRRFDGTTLSYIEGSTTGLIVPDQGPFNYGNGGWHTCTVFYSFGTITVNLDGVQIMTGTTNLDIVGQFGFSASTGGFNSKHSIKNVLINNTIAPPVTANLSYCLNQTAATLTAVVQTGYILQWYTAPTGGVALAAAPTPSTSTLGSTTYYVSSSHPGCDFESERTPLVVSVTPLPTSNRIDSFCIGSSYQFYGRTLTSGGVYDTILPVQNGDRKSVV